MNNKEKILAEFDKRTDMPERFEDIEQSLYGDEEYPESKYELSLTKLESFLSESIDQAIAEERERVREWATEKKSVLEKKEEEHHKKFLQDEIRYKHNPTANNLEIMRLHEGSTSAYFGGLTQGKIEALTDLLSSLDKLTDK